MNCDHRGVRCDYCQGLFAANRLKNHHQDCDSRVEQCNLCGADVVRRDREVCEGVCGVRVVMAKWSSVIFMELMLSGETERIVRV